VGVSLHFLCEGRNYIGILPKVLEGQGPVDVHMTHVYTHMAAEIQALRERLGKKQILVAIAGPPGAGKTTISTALMNLIPNSIQLPMDGYHYYKRELNEFENPTEAFRRRGAYWTFNGAKFVEAIKSLKENQCGDFPSFDHGVGDPIENDIHVTSEHEVVITEGNYLLIEEAPWDELKGLFDFSYFVQCDLAILEDRVYKRHKLVGCTEEEARDRVVRNDSLNAQYILTTAGRADKIIQSI
jgi:pantothenate kinase